MSASKIKNRIISSCLQKFSESHEIINSDESNRFEHFVNYCVAIKENGYSNFDFESFYTGTATQGIDGVIIILNDNIVGSIEELDEMLEAKTINAEFVLVQTKRSNSFNNAEISNLMTFAYNFFSDEEEKVFKNLEMKNFIEMTSKIYSAAERFDNNPKLKLYYVTTSSAKAEEDKNLQVPINVNTKSLQNLGIFSNITVEVCGASELQQMYQNATAEISAKFELVGNRQLLMFSENEGTENEVLGYFFVIPFKEYKKLFLDDAGKLKPVFNDNIRDFLGNNSVNNDIAETITKKNTDAFCMLNNGITVIANFGNITGKNVTIKNYQIVNGCQTTHVLYEHKDFEMIDELLIPIRLIVTTNENLKNQIANATNNQTAVTKEQLIALSTFQRDLEEYYKTFSEEKIPLYYERRTGQYISDTKILKARVIDIKKQAKAVAAMFLNEPDTASRRYGAIRNKFGEAIFNEGDSQKIYYVSALSLYRIENFIKTGKIDRKFNAVRYHMIMLLRLLLSKNENEILKFNSRKIEEIGDKLLHILNDDNECLKYFSAISKHIELLVDNNQQDNGFWRNKSTTQNLIKEIGKLKNTLKIDNKN